VAGKEASIFGLEVTGVAARASGMLVRARILGEVALSVDTP